MTKEHDRVIIDYLSLIGSRFGWYLEPCQDFWNSIKVNTANCSVGRRGTRASEPTAGMASLRGTASPVACFWLSHIRHSSTTGGWYMWVSQFTQSPKEHIMIWGKFCDKKERIKCIYVYSDSQIIFLEKF